MPSSTLQAHNKKKDTLNSPLTIFIVVAIIGLIVGSFVFIRDPFAILTILTVSIILFSFYVQPPKSIKLVIDNEGIDLDEEKYRWDELNSWDILESKNHYEIILSTKKWQSNVINFYLEKNNNSAEVWVSATEFYGLDRDEKLAYRDTVHNFQRIINIK
jgi:hypothetical protein